MDSIRLPTAVAQPQATPRKPAGSRRKNLQGWAVDEGHPLHGALSDGAVWKYLSERLDQQDSPEWIAGFSYLCAHAGAVLSSLPHDPRGEILLRLLMDAPALGCAEDALLDAALRHVAASEHIASPTTASWRPDEVARAMPKTRELVVRLRLDSLSVHAVLRAVEPLGVVDEPRLLSFYRAAALGHPGTDLRSILRIVQGEHPYSHDDTGTVEEIRVESGGCRRILVEFDRRCTIEEGADLLFYEDPESTKLIAQWSSCWPRRGAGIRYLLVEMPVFYIEFRCAAGAKPAWGWKVLITPLRLTEDEN